MEDATEFVRALGDHHILNVSDRPIAARGADEAAS